MFPRSYRIGELTWVINDVYVCIDWRVASILFLKKKVLGINYQNRAIFQVLLEISRNADPFG